LPFWLCVDVDPFLGLCMEGKEATCIHNEKGGLTNTHKHVYILLSFETNVNIRSRFKHMDKKKDKQILNFEKETCIK
jgi:hypothetical protein